MADQKSVCLYNPNNPLICEKYKQKHSFGGTDFKCTHRTAWKEGITQNSNKFLKPFQQVIALQA